MNKAGKLLKQLYTRGFTLEPDECYCWFDTPTPLRPCCDDELCITFIFCDDINDNETRTIEIDCYEKGEVFLRLNEFNTIGSGKNRWKYYILGDPGNGEYKRVNKVNDLVDIIVDFYLPAAILQKPVGPPIELIREGGGVK